MYVHQSTVYNSKDPEPTQIPTNDRLGKENVAHIHYGLVYRHKNNLFVSFEGTWMNSGNHHSQLSNTKNRKSNMECSHS